MPEPGRKPLISGNWKMHHTHLEAIATVQKLSYLLDKEDYEEVDVSVHPAFTALRSLQTLLDADRIPISLGAQNCYWENQGAFTGEVSPTMLAKLAVSYVIVGHSERRQLFGESDEVVARKARGRARRGDDADPLRRRDVGRAGGGSVRGPVPRPGGGGAGGTDR